MKKRKSSRKITIWESQKSWPWIPQTTMWYWGFLKYLLYDCVEKVQLRVNDRITCLRKVEITRSFLCSFSFFFLHFFFSDRVSLCISGSPRTHYIVQVELELVVILLPLPPEWWDYRHVPPHPAIYLACRRLRSFSPIPLPPLQHLCCDLQFTKPPLLQLWLC